jgi:hypothetical protein
MKTLTHEQLNIITTLESIHSIDAIVWYNFSFWNVTVNADGHWDWVKLDGNKE